VYLKHFGLTRFPFDKDLSADELFVSSQMRELGTRLGHLVEMNGMGLVTGDPGCGKSCAARAMASRLHSGLYKVFYVPLSTGNPMDLYKSIAWEMGLSVERCRAALYRQIKNEVTRLSTETRTRPVLVLDEAQGLRSDVLEEIRLLTNYAMDSQNRLCLLFCGQTELRRRLGMAVHEPLAQRIVVRYHMGPLAGAELSDYLAHLLRLAGTELPLFEPAAVEALFQATQGLPRKINALAHHALIAAALAKAKSASVDHVQAALTEVT
jgi:type II secretory pathway predicted ATPase ExeA